MIAGRRLLGLIPARGGSKGLPRKNVLNLSGKPLIAWTIEAALGSRYLDRVILSSDDEEIMDVAAEWGCEVPFRRPDHLAADDTPGVAPVIHAIELLGGFDYVVVLQPTSPLRTSADIDGTVDKCIAEGATSCVSIVEAATPPEWMYTLGGRDYLEPLLPGSERVLRRQDARPAFVLNGAVYVAEVEALRRTGRLVTEDTLGYRMPPERSADIDTALDLAWCEFLLDRQARVGAVAVSSGL